MKNTIIASFLLLMSTTVFAQGKYYLSYEISDNELDGINVVSGASLDKDDTGYAILGGIHVNDNLDIELGYKDFGEASLSGVSGNQFTYRGTTYQFNATATLSYEGDAYLIGLKPKYKINDNHLNILLGIGGSGPTKRIPSETFINFSFSAVALVISARFSLSASICFSKVSTTCREGAISLISYRKTLTPQGSEALSISLIIFALTSSLSEKIDPNVIFPTSDLIVV